MSVQNFIPQLWEAQLFRNYYQVSIANMITTAPTKIDGDTIIWNNVSNVTVKDYNGAVSYEELDLTDVKMLMDIHKYWAFKVHDIDAVQAAGDLKNPHIWEAAQKMARTYDVAVLDEALKTTNAVAIVTEDKAYDRIVKAHALLNKNEVPFSDRYTIINQDVLTELQLDPRYTLHKQILDNGVVDGGFVNGVQLVVREALNAGKYAILALQKEGLGFGMQLKETEAMRSETSFADLCRGLSVGGTKILRPTNIAKCVKP